MFTRVPVTIYVLLLLALLVSASFAQQHPTPPAWHPLAQSIYQESESGQTESHLFQPVTSQGVADLEFNEYLNMDVALVIYTHSVMDTVTPGAIDTLLSEVQEARTFFARNSACRLNVNISDTIIIDRFLSLDQFQLLYTNPNGYLLPWFSVDGTHSVEQDLYDLGYTDNQFSTVFVYYAWQNRNDTTAGVGGIAYPPSAGLLGQTAYAAVPLSWLPEGSDHYFIHEFLHVIDMCFSASGEQAFTNADSLPAYDAVYDCEYTFNAWQLRSWPFDDWSLMSAPWGSVRSFTDVDNDSVPDNDDLLAITEATLGSSVGTGDTDSDGLRDLHEMMSGHMFGSDMHSGDTDFDGLTDDIDKYPLDSVWDTLLPADWVIDGEIDAAASDNLVAIIIGENETDLRAEFYAGYCDSGFYFAVHAIDNEVWDYYSDPWWNDGIHIEFDVSGDGFWGHGEDNYGIWLSVKGDGETPQVSSEIIHENRVIGVGDMPLSDITARYHEFTGGYDMELFVRHNSDIGFLHTTGDTARLQLSMTDYDYHQAWDRDFAYTRFIDFVLAESGGTCCQGIVGSIAQEPNCDNIDQVVDIGDLTLFINYLFIDFLPLCCEAEGDIAPAFYGGEHNGVVDIADLTALIEHLFISFNPMPPCE